MAPQEAQAIKEWLGRRAALMADYATVSFNHAMLDVELTSLDLDRATKKANLQADGRVLTRLLERYRALTPPARFAGVARTDTALIEAHLRKLAIVCKGIDSVPPSELRESVDAATKVEEEAETKSDAALKDPAIQPFIETAR